MKITLIPIMLTLCLSLDPLILSAKTTESVDQLLKILIESPDWQARKSAAAELNLIPNDQKPEKVRQALIDELIKEFNRLKQGKMKECQDCKESDDEGEYYSWLYDIVSDMKDDKAFPFFKSLGSPTALFKYGDKGIEEILKNIEPLDCAQADADLYYLKKAVEPKETGYVAKGIIRDKIKQELMKSLNKFKHPEHSVEWYEVRAMECAAARKQIVSALGYLAEASDNEVMPLIKSAAEDDPFFLDMSKKKDYEGPQKKYIVREEAQKILEKLKADERKK